MRFKWLWLAKPYNLIIQWGLTRENTRLAFQIQSMIDQLCLKTDLRMSFQFLFQIDQVPHLSATHWEEHGRREWSQLSTDLCIKSKPLMWLEPRIIVKAVQDSLVATKYRLQKGFEREKGYVQNIRRKGQKATVNLESVSETTWCRVQTPVSWVVK